MLNRLMLNANLKACHLYIAKTQTGKYYTGISSNPKVRINRHNNGSGSRFTQQHGPFKLVYVSPSFASKSEARKFEIKIKGWSQSKKREVD